MANNSQSVITDYSNDQRFLELISSSFNGEEQQLFIQSFKQYLDYGNDKNAFVVNLDDIWQWLGFSHKKNPKNILLKHFIENEDYIINTIDENFAYLSGKAKNINNTNDENIETRGGHNRIIIKMNVSTFKDLCMISETSKSKIVRKYYIKMENILFQYIQEIFMKSKENETKLIKDMQKVMEDASWEKHNALLSGYSKTPVVYFIKMMDLL